MSLEPLAEAVEAARGAHHRVFTQLSELMAASGLRLRRAVLGDGQHDLVLFLDFAGGGPAEAPDGGIGGGETLQALPPWGGGLPRPAPAPDPTFTALPVR